MATASAAFLNDISALCFSAAFSIEFALHLGRDTELIMRFLSVLYTFSHVV